MLVYRDFISKSAMTLFISFQFVDLITRSFKVLKADEFQIDSSSLYQNKK